MQLSFEEKAWWGYVEEDIRELLKESRLLLAKAEGWEEKFHDYAFLVFPAAKAYEGFLKKLFLDMKIISENDYYGKIFRIGKALNPNLDERFRQESVYDKLVGLCDGRKLADKLWDTWRESRNLLFHWFPKERNAITLIQAKENVSKIIDAMDVAFRECKIKMDAK